jgi:glucose-6-phosphate 1-dehydrogenase
MSSIKPAPPCTIVVFGAAGDLTQRLLIAAVYNLACGKLLDEGLQIKGLDHHDLTTDGWRTELHDALVSFTKNPGAEFHPDHIDQSTWDWIARRSEYTRFDFENFADYAKLKERLRAGNAIFYLAVASRFFGTITENLGKAGLLEESDGAFRRLAVEKPFGADLASARALNARILTFAGESQIYRVDHFLGKEPVQGIMPLRFDNDLFEPMWTREHVDSVQITAAETLGVEGRGGFYDVTGALRDMVPNHLFSLLTLTAMEPPGSYEADAVRDEKVKLLRAIRPIAPEDAVRGQYAGYLAEENIAPDSRTETYAALRVQIANPRWDGVPFYVRTGKRLARHLTTIALLFRKGNVLTLGIAPDPGFTATFVAKEPGPEMHTGNVRTAFAYKDFFEEPPTVGYETLLYQLMTGNQLLFQREDMVDASWAAVAPVLDAWGASRDQLPAYRSGGEGPDLAAALLERDGRRWLPLT